MSRYVKVSLAWRDSPAGKVPVSCVSCHREVPFLTAVDDGWLFCEGEYRCREDCTVIHIKRTRKVAYSGAGA